MNRSKRHHLSIRVATILIILVSILIFALPATARTTNLVSNNIMASRASHSFSIDDYCTILRVNIIPSGTGTYVATAPNCGYKYLPGTVIDIVETPNSGHTLSYWGGDCYGETTDRCTLTMDYDRFVNIIFN